MKADSARDYAEGNGPRSETACAFRGARISGDALFLYPEELGKAAKGRIGSVRQAVGGRPYLRNCTVHWINQKVPHRVELCLPAEDHAGGPYARALTVTENSAMQRYL